MTTYTVPTLINSHESGFFRGALAILRSWSERARARRELSRWSERDLHDIGLSWSTIAEEVNKPFWRA
ncbi:DUF1127 domain-containing protein [Bradyrhizobium sp. LHD-71]|uniref:DUF1127 domain-containing protein n=1 Tax=Bradyrhizobium sp. LHD-71 TaxID=3072141 RepID=UPI00280E77C7|nr:DUF1127 domain-containing protein [Bradyrhizobium sp. LHD-71]MDQ8727150.1 DUF1127 domain-containing protein [Bradyrhizobium sp. LHD-71]